MSLSTHVLDSALGRPAANVRVSLDRDGERLASASTDADGRVRALCAELPAGTYRLLFDTGGYFAATGTATFFPQATVTFTVADPDQHYHVPILLSPFAMSTYRGS
jgi:5-hydroxyisourate hydrolase